MRDRRRFGPVLWLLLAASCASESVDRAVSSYEEHRRRLAAGRVLSSASLPVAAPRSLAELVELARVRNPSLRAAEARARGAAERPAAEGTLEDPMIGVMPDFGSPVTEMPQTAVGPVGWGLEVSQALPFPGKIGSRVRSAQAESDEAAASAAALRLEVVAEVAKLYYRIAYVDRALAITEEERGVLDRFLEAAEARYRVGQVTQTDLLLAQAERSRIDERIIELRRERRIALAALNALLDLPAEAPLGELEVPPLPPPPAPGEDLLVAAASRPELAARAARVEAMKADLDHAQLRYWPDLVVSARYNFVEGGETSHPDDGQDQYWASLGVNLPLWRKRYDANLRAAAAELEAAIASFREESARTAGLVADGLARANAADELVALYDRDVLPQALGSRDSAEAGYRAARVELLRVLDQERLVLGTRLARERAYFDALAARADLARAVGAELFPPTR